MTSILLHSVTVPVAPTPAVPLAGSLLGEFVRSSLTESALKMSRENLARELPDEREAELPVVRRPNRSAPPPPSPPLPAFLPFFGLGPWSVAGFAVSAPWQSFAMSPGSRWFERGIGGGSALDALLGGPAPVPFRPAAPRIQPEPAKSTRAPQATDLPPDILVVPEMERELRERTTPKVPSDEAMRRVRTLVDEFERREKNRSELALTRTDRSREDLPEPVELLVPSSYEPAYPRAKTPVADRIREQVRQLSAPVSDFVPDASELLLPAVEVPSDRALAESTGLPVSGHDRGAGRTVASARAEDRSWRFWDVPYDYEFPLS